MQREASVEPQGKAVLSPDGNRLFVPLGTRRRVVSFDVAAYGMLTRGDDIEVGDRVIALQVSADGATLWAALFTEGTLVAINLPDLAERKRITLRQGAWDLLELQSRHEL